MPEAPGAPTFSGELTVVLLPEEGLSGSDTLKTGIARWSVTFGFFCKLSMARSKGPEATHTDIQSYRIDSPMQTKQFIEPHSNPAAIRG